MILILVWLGRWEGNPCWYGRHTELRGFRKHLRSFSVCPHHTHTHTHTHTTPAPHHTHTPVRLNTWCSHFCIFLDGSCWSLFSGNSAVPMHSHCLPLLLVQRDGALHWALQHLDPQVTLLEPKGCQKLMGGPTWAWNIYNFRAPL